MKNHIRVIGFDDSPFSFDNRYSMVVGIVCRLPLYIEGMARFRVEIDGMDSTEGVIQSVSKSRFKENIKMIMINGISFAGFNVIDIEQIYNRTGIPVVTVTRNQPDIHSMKNAMRKKFGDWEARLEIIEKKKVVEIDKNGNRLWIAYSGISYGNAREVILKSLYIGKYPEVLRIAHIVASMMKRGESRGKP